jgi:hypothetical protein
MDKRGAWALVFSFIVLILFVAIMFSFFHFYKPLDEKKIIKRAISNVSGIRSPTAGLSSKQVEIGFNESYISSFLEDINAKDLRNIAISREVPRIKLVVDNVIYSASVNRGKITVKKANVSNPDIIITSTKSEIAQMVTNKRYISTSFKKGKSSLELVADKASLIAKGYIRLYTKITGNALSSD